MADQRMSDPASPRTAPPDDAPVPTRHPMAPAPGETVPSHYSRCFGCGEDAPHGLHVRATAGRDLSVEATFAVTEHHQGAPGLAHGGLLSAAFDEALGALTWLLAVPSVTARLEVDFLKPVPVGSVLHIRAEITGQQGRKIYCRATGHLDAADGPVAVQAAALFISVGMEHYTTHGRAEDVAAAADDRRVRGTWNRLEINP